MTAQLRFQRRNPARGGTRGFNVRVRRTLALLTGLTTIFLFAIGVAPPPAQAAQTCSFSSGTLTVTTTAGEDPTVSRNSAGTISVSGCASISGGPATTSNTTAISLNGDAGANNFGIQLANGGWGSINWTVDGGSGTDALTITGSTGTDTVKVGGAGGIDLHGRRHDDGPAPTSTE